jgi:PAS domain S-box-containing protein
MLRKLTGAVEHTADMIIITNRAGIIEYVNPAFETITGYTSAEVLGKTPGVLKSDRYNHEFFEQMWQIILAGEVLQVEFTNKKKSGELFYQSTTITPIKDDQHNITHFVATAKDITDQIASNQVKEQTRQRIQRQQETLIRLSTHPALAEGRLGDILPEIAAAAGASLGVKRANIWRLSGEDNQLICLAACGQSSGGQKIQLDDYPAYLAALKAGQILTLDDVNDRRARALRVDYWDVYGITSAIDAPVRFQGEIIGAVCFEHVGPKRVWTPDEVAFAGQIANLVSQAFLQARARRQRDDLEASSDILQALNATPNFAEAMPAIILGLQAITGCQRVSLLGVENRNGWYYITTIAQSNQDIILADKVTVADTAAAKSLLAGRIHRTPDLAAEAEFPVERALLEAGYRSRLSLPLRIDERVFGVLTLSWPHKNGYSVIHMPLLSQIANAIALAMERKRLFDEAQSRAMQQAALNAIIAAAVAAPDILSLAQTALGHILAALNLAVGVIWVANQRAERGLSAETAGLLIDLTKANLPSPPEPVVITNWDDTPASAAVQAMAPAVLNTDIKASLVAPILTEGVQIGGVALAAVQPRLWVSEEVALVEAVGRQLGGAAVRLGLLEQTREQARLVQQIMDTVPEGVIFLNHNREIALTNTAAQNYLHLLTPALPGSQLTHLGEFSVNDLLKPPLPEQPYHEIMVKKPKFYIFEVAARPFTTGTEVGGWVLIIRNVTSSRRIQEQIQEQERLAAVGHLAAGIAHDFNNLLTGIIGFAELLQLRVTLPVPGPEYVDRIIKSGRQATNLISQILDFSRKSVSQQQALDLVPFLKESIKFLERTIPENIRIVLEITPGEHAVNADSTKLQQVLTNLAVNARDVMPAGGELRVRLSTLSLQPDDPPPCQNLPPGQWVTLAVSDTGSGIPPEIMTHIFEPFFTTKERGKGTGLGLAQVYGIIKQHQGFIDVHSRAGQGTTFHIYLPALPEKNRAAKAAPEDELVFGRGETILLVEDDADVLEVNQTILDGLGYCVLTAENGLEAQQVYQQHHETIALVLADMVMPDMDGLQLFTALKSGHPNVKFIVMTGYPLDKEGKKALSEGIITWLQKPVTITQMARAIHQAIN